jgi:hypothetical protein
MKAKLEKAIHAAGLRLFAYKSGHEKSNAQQNLDGRTHYADNETLRYFKARINHAVHLADGLLFLILESVASKPYEIGQNKRFVVFDVFGTVVNDREEWHATTEKARKAAEAFLAGFDAEGHTERALRDHANRLHAEAQRITSALDEKDAD